MSDPMQDALEAVAALQIAGAKIRAHENFVTSIVACMDQEKVGLEESIRNNEQMIHIIADAEPMPPNEEHLRPEVHTMMVEVFAEAAQYVRDRVAASRELVRLADQS